MHKKEFSIPGIALLLLLAGCVGIPVRNEVKVDLSLPVGKMEGNQFIGIRFPFKVSVPSQWRLTTQFPKFMLDLGYDKEGLEESQVFIFNPTTQSNVQIDFTPADRYTRFDQRTIDWLATVAMGSFASEIQKEYGKNIRVEISPTKAYSLKGVPFAAKKYATYTLKGVNREQGWVFAFAEPYQIFILYMALEKNGMNDRQAIKTILDSFEFISNPTK